MKFEIFKSEKDKKFYFRLKARNGQIILSSQGYADKSGAKNGIKSVQTHSKKDENFERKESKNGKFHFNLVASNKQIIGSSQVYRSKQSMETGIQSVRRVAPQAVVQEE